MIAFHPTSVAGVSPSCRSTKTEAILQVFGASLLLALFSQIKIILPWTPIPLTLQTFAVLLIGASLGSRKGAAAILFYYAEVLMGFPVLSGGAVDPLIFFGPKGGYVLGYCLEVYCIGWFAENWKSPASLWMGGLLGCTLQMILGVSVLANFIGWSHVWMMGFVSFIPAEIMKIVAVCVCMSKASEFKLKTKMKR